MTTLDMALLYSDMGLSCFPLPCKSKVPPKGFKWTTYRDRQPSRDELRQWFSSGDRNIGIVTGDVSGGLAVRDFDQAGAYERWRAHHQDIAEILPTVKTGRGYHLYARGHADKTVTFSDGELRYGTYALAPSSLHPSGVTYTWTHLPGDDIPEVDLVAAGLLTDWGECNTEAQEAQKHTQFCASMLHPDVSQALRKCIPSRPGHRHKCLFRLARELKAVPDTADLPAKSLVDVLREWHRLALPYIATKDFGTSWLEFCVAWERVRYPVGTSPIDDAWEAAKTAAVSPQVADWGNPKLTRLVALCLELQKLQGDRPFYLDSRTAGKLLEVDHTVAWRWLRGLAAAGVLELVKSGGRGRANEYRYVS